MDGTATITSGDGKGTKTMSTEDEIVKNAGPPDPNLVGSWVGMQTDSEAN